MTINLQTPQQSLKPCLYEDVADLPNYDLAFKV
jgi:hypothetical protein